MANLGSIIFSLCSSFGSGIAKVFRVEHHSRIHRCGICSRPLNVDVDPMSADTGGDCWGCIGEIEVQIGDNLSVGLIEKEIAWGWRFDSGAPKPQIFFTKKGSTYLKSTWIHQLDDEPVELWSELDRNRNELRKIEIWCDGRIGYADRHCEKGPTWLAEATVPTLDQIAHDTQFHVQEISPFAFESKWDELVGIRIYANPTNLL